MADREKERDWDKEMAEVDRLLKKLPDADPREWLGTWAKVGLGVLVGIGVAPGVWPYSHGCGLRLIFYLLGVTTVVAAGLWASVASWRRRLGFAHVVSQVLIVWGILLLTREVLPRIGSADAAALWLCPDVQPHR